MNKTKYKIWKITFLTHRAIISIFFIGGSNFSPKYNRRERRNFIINKLKTMKSRKGQTWGDEATDTSLGIQVFFISTSMSKKFY